MAMMLAAHAQGTVRVLHVVEWVEPQHRPLANAADYQQQAVDEARARLRSVVQPAAGGDVTVLDVAVARRPYLAILREAESHPTDLIALGVRGRGAVDIVLTGSTTNRVLRESRCPVLTVREDAASQVSQGQQAD